MIKTIPLNKLRRSKANVRRASEARADEQLKADIKAHGLLQNLVVTALKKPRGHFAVEAGGRRLAALQRLSEEGAIAADLDIACLVLDDRGGAEEVSLAENFQQLRMNPADECQAFQRLVAQGLDAEDIARRFGLTRRFVDGRLRLADLAPVVLDALGANTISLDVAKAFAATSDRERQAYVYAQLCEGYGMVHPDSIRRMMTQATLPGSDRRARFVGEPAYVEAGGRIERDLFADDDTARWLDIDLVERLATDKLAALADARREELGIAFVTPTLDGWIGYRHTEGLERVALEVPPPTDAERSELERLEEALGGIVDRLEQEELSDQERAELEERMRSLDDEIDAIENKPPVLVEELKDRLGTFLLLDEGGRPQLDRQYYLNPLEDDDDAGADAGEETASAPSGSGEPSAAAAAARAPAGLSQRHADELAMQRRDILAVHLARDPALALSLAIFLMADGLTGYRGERIGSTIAARRPNDPVLASQMPETAALAARQEATLSLDRSWTDGESAAERFATFRALDPEARAAWLGEAVAISLEASLQEAGHRRCGLHDDLGDLLAIDVSAWWRPTGANYFDRVPKGVSLAALNEVGGAELAARYGKAKKAELAEACERLFAGGAIVDAATREAALAWVPAAMRFAPSPWTAAPDADAGDQSSTLEAAEDGEAQPHPAPSDDAGVAVAEAAETKGAVHAAAHDEAAAHDPGDADLSADPGDRLDEAA